MWFFCALGGTRLSPEVLRTQWKVLQQKVRERLGVKYWACMNGVRKIVIADGWIVMALGSNAFAQQMLAGQTDLLAELCTEATGAKVVGVRVQLGDLAEVAGTRE